MTIIPRELHPRQKALRDLAARGYLIHDGQVWWIANDDSDQGLEEVLIGPAEEDPEDTYWMLSNHHWPTTGPVLCGMCHDAESELGGYCPSCIRELVRETMGEAAFEAMRDGAI
jgi:hypothetical protein